MEWLDTILVALGGGPMAVALIALGWSWNRKDKKIDELYEKRSEDQKEHTAQVMEFSGVLRDTTQVMREAIKMMEGRSHGT